MSERKLGEMFKSGGKWRFAPAAGWFEREEYLELARAVLASPKALMAYSKNLTAMRKALS